MLNIPKEVKELLTQSGIKKNMRMRWVDGTHADIINSEILSESVKFTESICSNQYQTGLCEAAVFECDIFRDEDVTNDVFDARLEIDVESLIPDQEETVTIKSGTTFTKTYDVTNIEYVILTNSGRGFYGNASASTSTSSQMWNWSNATHYAKLDVKNYDTLTFNLNIMGLVGDVNIKQQAILPEWVQSSSDVPYRFCSINYGRFKVNSCKVKSGTPLRHIISYGMGNTDNSFVPYCSYRCEVLYDSDFCAIASHMLNMNTRYDDKLTIDVFKWLAMCADLDLSGLPSTENGMSSKSETITFGGSHSVSLGIEYYYYLPPDNAIATIDYGEYGALFWEIRDKMFDYGVGELDIPWLDESHSSLNYDLLCSVATPWFTATNNYTNPDYRFPLYNQKNIYAHSFVWYVGIPYKITLYADGKAQKVYNVSASNKLKTYDCSSMMSWSASFDMERQTSGKYKVIVDGSPWASTSSAISAYASIAAYNCVLDRETMRYKLIKVRETNGLVPSKDLKPSQTLKPSVSTGDVSKVIISRDMMQSITSAEKLIKVMDFTGQGSYTGYYDRNRYSKAICPTDINNNVLMSKYKNLIVTSGKYADFTVSDASYWVYREEFFIDGIFEYRPYSAKTIGLPYVEAGDWVDFLNEKNATHSFVARRTLSGIQNLSDTLETGDY